MTKYKLGPPTTTTTTMTDSTVGANDKDQQEKPPTESFLLSLIQRMHPSACLTAVQDVIEHEEPLDEAIVKIIRDLKKRKGNDDDDNGKAETKAGKRKQKALDRLYELSDVKHKENRTTLVTDHGIIEILLDTECLHSHCRITCLILNNLSIPFDNKQAMVRSDRLLNALLTTIHPLPEETYLVCICLMNLSFWQESHSRLLHYCPTPPNIPLENPKSLLRIIESIMLTYVPLLSQTTKLSVEGEAVRWTTGLLRNLVSEQQTHHHAKLIAETKLPRCLLSCLRDSHKPLSQWKRDTLEDLALQIVLNLAKWPESSKQLQHLKAQSYLEHIEGQGGIHDVRVSWIRCSLESLSS